jgi:uncharacterized protein (DUF1800 family)
MASPLMTAADVSRLFGRVAFGATALDLDLWTGRPYADAVNSLLDATNLPLPLSDEQARNQLVADPDAGVSAAREWWLERMRTTPFQVLERMTLLWHGHFATAVSRPPYLREVLKQNQTIRLNALGSFRDLVVELTVDPAMLFWLSGFENEVPYPNENYAREFFELFTLGKYPQVYREQDIREAARAFTGWYVDSTGTAKFAAARHDRKTKTVLGQRFGDLGSAEYRKVIDVALSHPVAPRYIAWKLVANLAYVPSKTNLLTAPDPLVAKVSATLRAKSWDIKEALRTLLLADEFRLAPPASRKQLVRQPVECLVHAAKALNVPCTGNALLTALDEMGQSLFDPVNVGGWPLGTDWLTPVSAIARFDAGLELYERASDATPLGSVALPAAEDLAGWAHKLGLAGVGANTTAAVNNYLRRASNATSAQRQAGVLALLLSSPEWVVM